MIRWQRSGCASAGKYYEAIQLVRESANFCNATVSGIQFQVFTERFGDIETIYLVADFENLEALDRVQRRLVTDEEYRALVGKTADLFIEGSWKDTVLAAVKL